MAFDMSNMSAKLHRKANRAERDALRGRMGPGRHKTLVDALAKQTLDAFMDGRIPTLLAYEGAHRHAVRAALCLQGWHWRIADTMAADVVWSVHMKLAAKRPSWNEGQPDWTIEAGTLIERTRCVRCHNDLPEGHHKFCSDLCRTSHHNRLWKIREADEDKAIWMAIRTI